MSITSFYFFLLFAVSLGIYYIIPKKFQWCALLGFSSYFYLESSAWITVLYFLIHTAITFTTALQIAALMEKKQKKVAGRYLFWGLFLNVGMLAVMKYSNFIVYNWNLIADRIGTGFYIEPFEVATPIGISFYTLISAGYMIDVYWEITEPEKNPFKVALFIGYFPQMTSGPISRFDTMKEQLFGGHSFEYETIVFGMQRMLWGIFKKLVISTRAAVVVDAIYENPTIYTGLYIWTAAFLFLLQLYTDFSGCMDIIMGISECYGIKLEENFRTPFFSRSVQEFWQRWHITLGAWFKDYVLYPMLKWDIWRKGGGKWLKEHMGKNLSKRFPSYVGMLCVWVLIGIWHGGAWKYILGIGIWFWLCIMFAQLSEPVFKKIRAAFCIQTNNFGYHFFQSLRVFCLIAFGDMFFRLDGFRETLSRIKAGCSLFNPWIFFDGSFETMGLSYRDQKILLFGIFLLCTVAVLQEKYGGARNWIKEQFLPFRWFVWIFLCLFILVNGTYGPGYSAAEFIYRGF